MNKKAEKLIRTTVSLPPEMLDRIKKAAQRRIEGGLNEGSYSGIVRLSVNAYLKEEDDYVQTVD
jgi:hypothetical protein